MICDDCGQVIRKVSHFDSVESVGHAKTEAGETICYDCCAKRDREAMIEDGIIYLYLVQVDKNPIAMNTGWEVHNWPGTLSFPVKMIREGHHNIARIQRNAWFKGPDGRAWRAYQVGDWTDIARCTRLKGSYA